VLGAVAVDRGREIDDRVEAAPLAPAPVGAEKEVSTAFSREPEVGGASLPTASTGRSAATPGAL
jgi:hypothetical protein